MVELCGNGIYCFLVAEALSLQAVVIHLKLRCAWVVAEDVTKPEGLGDLPDRKVEMAAEV